MQTVLTDCNEANCKTNIIKRSLGLGNNCKLIKIEMKHCFDLIRVI